MNNLESNIIDELYLFKKNEIWLALDMKSNALIDLEDSVGHIFAMKQRGYKNDEISKDLGVSMETVNTHLTQLNQNINAYRKQVRYISSNPKLRTMMLLISQSCNMRCGYCYADGGTYSQKDSPIMDIVIATKALELANHLGIDQIQFFGGEPLLAFDLMEQIVAYSHQQGFNFKYGLITNGTIINDNIAKFCSHNNIAVTVSLDGPAEVNDYCRKFTDGSGTYDQVVQGILNLNSERVPLSLQPVYSRRYISHASIKEILSELLQYSKSYILSYVAPFGDTYLQEDIMTEDELTKFFIDSIDFIFDMNEQKVPVIDVAVYNIIQTLFSEIFVVKKYICENMASRLTVFSNGDLSLCQFLNQDENRLGNVTSIHPKELLTRRKQVLEQFTSDRFESWFKNLIDLCITHLNITEQGKFLASYPKAYEEFIKHLLYRIATSDIDTILKSWRDYLEPETSL